MMKKNNFEEQFIEAQKNMITLCLEYVNSKADNVYIYASHETNSFAFNVFYKVKGNILGPHQINSVLNENEKIDDNQERIRAMLKIGNDDWISLIELLQANKQEIPTEMKLIYDVKANEMNTKFQYDYVYSQTSDLASSSIFMAWYNEIKSDNEKKMSVTKNKRF